MDAFQRYRNSHAINVIFQNNLEYSLLEWMLDPNPEKRISATKALEYYFSKIES